MKPSKRLRWWIAWSLFCSTAINYISRQTFSVLAPVITKELHLTHTGLGRIFASFQISYAVSWLAGGVFIDIVGPRLGLSLAVIWWSVVSMLNGLANSAFSFGLFRFLLGLGEGCNWPGANKVVAEWFPSEERGLACGVFDSGSSVGGAVAAVVVPFVAIKLGWRYAFALSGALGFCWLAVWLFLYHPLPQHPRLTREERDFIESKRDTAESSSHRGLAKWIRLLYQKNVWGIVLGRMFTDPIWWFYVFWLPQYMSDAKGFDLRQIATFTWIPFLAADIGNFSGGFASGFLIKRGTPVVRARKWVCTLSTFPILAGIPAVMVRNAYESLALISIAVWGYASWSTMELAFPTDLLPGDVVASVTGMSGLAAGVMGTLFTVAVGFLVDRFSYVPAFVMAATMPILGTLSVLLLICPRRRE
jgi:ACS family hexuronate transporter-like MFS transporter